MEVEVLGGKSTSKSLSKDILIQKTVIRMWVSKTKALPIRQGEVFVSLGAALKISQAVFFLYVRVYNTIIPCKQRPPITWWALDLCSASAWLLSE